MPPAAFPLPNLPSLCWTLSRPSPAMSTRGKPPGSGLPPTRTEELLPPFYQPLYSQYRVGDQTARFELEGLVRGGREGLYLSRAAGAPDRTPGPLCTPCHSACSLCVGDSVFEERSEGGVR